MRPGAILCLAALARCGSTASPAEAPAAIAACAPVERWAQHDADVLRAVVADLAADEELVRPRTNARTILVDARMEAARGFASDQQLSAEMPERWPQVRSLAQALRSRNAAPAELDVEFDDPDVRIVDFSRFWGLLSDFDSPRPWRENTPAHRLAVGLQRPAYASNGERAFARVFFGPSAHGATATLLLRRTASGWTVEWREVAHYW